MKSKSNLDYLRVATWDMSAAMDLFADLRRWASGWKGSKWLQYNGYRLDGCFYGTGEQKEKRHYIADFSGPISRDLMGMANDVKFYATRIDLQVTIPMPIDYEPFSLYAEIKALSKVNTSIIHSDTGSTIYIGARAGQKFARIYEKQLGDERWLRLEFEVKGRLANVVYLQLREGISNDTVFDHFLSKLKAPDYLKEFFKVESDGDIFLQAEREHDSDKQLEWLSSLEKSIVRMGNDHYQGPTVKGLLERWTRLIDKPDPNI